MSDTLSFVRSLVPEEGIPEDPTTRRKIRAKLRKCSFTYASAAGKGFTLNGDAFLYVIEDGTLFIKPTDQNLDAVERAGKPRAERGSGGSKRKKKKGTNNPQYAAKLEYDPATKHLSEEEYAKLVFEAFAQDEEAINPGEFEFGPKYYGFAIPLLRKHTPEAAKDYVQQRIQELQLAQKNPNLQIVLVQTSPRFTSYRTLGVGPI